MKKKIISTHYKKFSDQVIKRLFEKNDFSAHAPSITFRSVTVSGDRKGKLRS